MEFPGIQKQLSPMKKQRSSLLPAFCVLVNTLLSVERDVRAPRSCRRRRPDLIQAEAAGHPGHQADGCFPISSWRCWSLFSEINDRHFRSYSSPGSQSHSNQEG
jgi:hypothetical protein